MDFGLSEDQQLLVESIRGFLADKVSIERVRKLREDHCPNDREVWRAVAELGATGILIDEANGGSGLKLLDAAIVAQSLGYSVTPTPYVGSAVMVPIALSAHPNEQTSAWLRGVASGELAFATAVTELFSVREEAGVELEGGKLNGKAMMALDMCSADFVLVAVGSNRFAVVQKGAAGLESTHLSTLDETRCTSELVFAGVTPEAVFEDAATTVERMLIAGRIVLAADTIGACESMIEQAVAYSKERKQFDRVIGSFQAVKHMCAEMIAELEPARSLLWYAAHSFEASPDEAPLMACHALAHASEVGREIASISTQVHGGTGWTDEQNLHFWFKRIAVARHLLGGPEYLRNQAAVIQGSTRPSPVEPRPAQEGSAAMKTPLARELGLEFPIFAFTHCRDVAAAVSKAGGLGVLGIAGHSPAMLGAELDWIENEVGDKPYGVDLLLPAKFAGSDKGFLQESEMDAQLPAEHREFLDRLLTDHGVPELPADAKVPREIAVGYEQQREVIELVLDRGISLIASALGPPPQWMIDQGREKGVRVAALAGTVEHAKRHVDAGVDIVVAQGYEAGGHTGTISTLVLVPEVVDAVGSQVPVLAAGGIGNGRQITASLALGAQGVWCGSLWLTTEEAETHPVVKDKFLAAKSGDTVRSRSLTGKPARQLRSAWTDAWDDPANPNPLPMPLQPRLVREARARIDRTAHSNDGARQLSNYYVGQIVGSLNQVKSVRSVMEELANEYADTMERLDRVAEAGTED